MLERDEFVAREAERGTSDMYGSVFRRSILEHSVYKVGCPSEAESLLLVFGAGG